MAATVKTLLENSGDLYWGTHHDEPEYHYGISLEKKADMLIAQVVYVLSNVDEETDENVITPDVLMSCFTVADLESANIILSDNMDDCDEETLGWYCIELSVFNQADLDALKESSESLDDYLEIILQVLETTPEELQSDECPLDEFSFFDLLEELCGISDKIDIGELNKPLPFQFHLVGDALLGWESADEQNYR